MDLGIESKKYIFRDHIQSPMGDSLALGLLFYAKEMIFLDI